MFVFIYRPVHFNKSTNLSAEMSEKRGVALAAHL